MADSKFLTPDEVAQRYDSRVNALAASRGLFIPVADIIVPFLEMAEVSPTCAHEMELMRNFHDYLGCFMKENT